MQEPKTVKSFLKMALAIAYTNRDELKGTDSLTEEQYLALGNMRAGIQNDLSENRDLLQKFNLEYDGSK